MQVLAVTRHLAVARRLLPSCPPAQDPPSARAPPARSPPARAPAKCPPEARQPPAHLVDKQSINYLIHGFIRQLINQSIHSCNALPNEIFFGSIFY